MADAMAKTDFSTLKSQILSQRLTPVQLDFSGFLNQINNAKYPTETRMSDLWEQLEKYKPLNQCEEIEKGALNSHLALLKERGKLTEFGANKLVYKDSFAKIENGNAWYRHMLHSWLGERVEIDYLKHIAERELQDALHKIKQQEIDLAQLTDIKQGYTREQDKLIVEAFRAREATVMQNLAQVVGEYAEFPEVKIAPSTFPPSFPAPGLYNTYTQTFVYHLQEDFYPSYQMDWLYLHEAVPGHHFQAQQATNEPLCTDGDSIAAGTAFTEGWGAYVETLGSELGLYQDKASYAYALEWQILRALRVLIDVGIHYEGWTDAQAYALWKQYLPHNPKIMHREVKRIRTWPVQVITYVYGKARIIDALLLAKKQKPNTSQSTMHRQIIRFSHLPLLAVDHLAEYL